MPRVANRLLDTFEDRPLSKPSVLAIRRQPGSSGPHSPTSNNVVIIESSQGSPRNSVITADSVTRRMTIVEDGVEYEVHGGIVDIIQDANVDGVRHLTASNKWIRYLWIIIICLFIFLAGYQIWSQIMLYSAHPVATNIEAEYPPSIAFPTVAICNTNMYRLTYITDARQLNRQPTTKRALLSISPNSSVFDQILENNWDRDAVGFLKSAAHQKYRMILGCTWPNGSSCGHHNFRPIFTTTGICYAINTDPMSPVEVTGSGSGHGLRLLLNVESYERIEACNRHFKARAQPGLKILIYNQTDIPESTSNGVNVPPGYSMDIPFKMQHRHKLPSSTCIEETERHKQAASEDFFSRQNVRTCALRKYMQEIERKCRCTIREAFARVPESFNLPKCNVDDYFGCVEQAISDARTSGKAAGCLPPCESIDYTAWQDMNRLPSNIMPAIIDEEEQEDDEEEEEDIDYDKISVQAMRRSSKEEGAELFVCEESVQLNNDVVRRIKRQAHHAYEKQSRYQDDIHLRTKRLIEKLRFAKDRVIASKWGWKTEDFESIYSRLNSTCPCFTSIREKHSEVILAMSAPTQASDEKRTQQLHMLLDASSFKKEPEKYKTVSELKGQFGDAVETMMKRLQMVLEYLDKLWNIFSEKNYQLKMDADLSRMDRVLQLMKQYENGKLQRRAWAERMQSRHMKHFFEEEFYDGWYQPINSDLQQKLQKAINDAEENGWKLMQDELKDGLLEQIGSVIFFGEYNPHNATKFKEFLSDIRSCANTELNATSLSLLDDFKKKFKSLQAAYNKLFNSELPNYLENFDFDRKFEGDNFAMVNIYLHTMHLEHWRQDKTYTFWSLACDIGGALGLFLGASLLTIIELIYLCLERGLCQEKMRKIRDSSMMRKITKKPPHKEAYSPHDSMSSPKSIIHLTARNGNSSPGSHPVIWANPITEDDEDIIVQKKHKKRPKNGRTSEEHCPTMDDLTGVTVIPKGSIPKISTQAPSSSADTSTASKPSQHARFKTPPNLPDQKTGSQSSLLNAPSSYLATPEEFSSPETQRGLRSPNASSPIGVHRRMGEANDEERTPVLRDDYRSAMTASPEPDSSSYSESAPFLFAKPKTDQNLI